MTPHAPPRKKPAPRGKKFNPPDLLAAASVIATTKSGTHLTSRERDVAASVLAGQTDPERLEDRPLIREAVIEGLAKLGVDVSYLSARLKEGLEATDLRLVTNNGVITDERRVASWGARKSYLDTVLEIVGVKSGKSDAPRQNVQVNIGYKSHLAGSEPELVKVTSPKDGVIKRRMQSQRPFNRSAA